MKKAHTNDNIMYQIRPHWIVTSFVGINCELENLQNGQVAITTAGVMTAEYRCDEGYVLVGRAQRTCRRRNGSNQWSGNQPRCESKIIYITLNVLTDKCLRFFCPYVHIVIDCGDSPSLLNGSVSTNGSTLHSVARYSCNEGFNMRGSNTLVCQYDGLWSENPPICEGETKGSV